MSIQRIGGIYTLSGAPLTPAEGTEEVRSPHKAHQRPTIAANLVPDLQDRVEISEEGTCSRTGDTSDFWAVAPLFHNRSRQGVVAGNAGIL